jgi:uncharacterized protein YndB with AHSA1/START domain
VSIRVATTIEAPPEAVWSSLADVGSHVEWMADAEAIRFASPQHRGVGTTFDCDTRVGPFRLTDRMEVTEWDEGRVMGVRHAGLVKGEGRFTLAPVAGGRHTRFTWEERLAFPWWLTGPVLAAVWRRNLRRLKRTVERGG